MIPTTCYLQLNTLTKTNTFDKLFFQGGSKMTDQDIDNTACFRRSHLPDDCSLKLHQTVLHEKEKEIITFFLKNKTGLVFIGKTSKRGTICGVRYCSMWFIVIYATMPFELIRFLSAKELEEHRIALEYRIDVHNHKQRKAAVANG